MGVVVIESSKWELNPSLYGFIIICCFLSIALFPRFSKINSNNSNKFPSPSLFSDHFLTPSSHRYFLFLYSLASVMEGVWSVFGEFEFVYYGMNKEQILFSLCLGFGTSLLFGSLLGFLSDSIGGHNKACLMFCILHLFVGICKRIVSHPCVLLPTLSLSLATSIFSFGFEAWLVIENEKQGHRQDTLTHTFWLMTFFESASLIGSQVLANWLLASNVEKGIASSSTATIFLAIIGIICVAKGWKQTPNTALVNDHEMSYTHTFSDKRILLLGFAHACLQFSTAIFWILWAPTLVADGREVHLGLIYPCLLGARMLGSTVFPWLLSGPLSLRTEDCLVYAFTVLGLALSIVAYDYQEIGVLVSLFCLFHAGVGLIIPSLARLRTMVTVVPTFGSPMVTSRRNVYSITSVLVSVVVFTVYNIGLATFVTFQRGYYQNIENSTMVALAALGLFMAAGSMHLLKRWGKQPYQSWHKS